MATLDVNDDYAAHLLRIDSLQSNGPYLFHL